MRQVFVRYTVTILFILTIIALADAAPLITGSSRGSNSSSNSSISINENDEKFQQRITLDVGYLQPIIFSNRAVGEFGIGYVHAFSWLFDIPGDALSKNKKDPLSSIIRGGLAIGSFFLMDYLPVGKWMLPYHEFGHGTRIAAAGYEPIYYYVGSFTNKGGWDGPYTNYFMYFISGLFSSKSGGVTSSLGNSVVGGAGVPNYWWAVGSMGGMNNEMYFAEILEDDIYYNGGHLTYAAFYYEGKLAAYDYVQATKGGAFGSTLIGDIGNIIGYYNSKGYGIGLSTIETASLISLILSSSTYSLLYSGYNFAVNGDPTVRGFEIYNFRIPDINLYLTSKGLSYQIKSAYRYKDVTFPISLEMVFAGGFGMDLGFGIRKEYTKGNGQKLILQGGAILNIPEVTGIGLNGYAKWVSKKNAYALGLFLHNLNNFEGERHITNLAFGPFGVDIVANYTLYY
jgi:hypothetical protein